jgi:hypothetical protein
MNVFHPAVSYFHQLHKQSPYIPASGLKMDGACYQLLKPGDRPHDPAGLPWLRKSFLVALMILVVTARVATAQTTMQPIFTYHSSFWLNLHQYLYVLGRIQAKMPDIQRRAVAGVPDDEAKGLALLNDRERETWREIVRAYAAGASRQDAVFDEPLVVAGQALARARDSATLDGTGLDETLKELLERAAPIYRKAWWPSHEAANRARIAELDGLVQKHGPAILAYLTRAYEKTWVADGYPVQFTAFSNWAGAFSTRGQHLVFSSLDPGLGGNLGLETLFHEAMHQWDGPVYEQLTAAAKTQQKQVPGNLSHAMIFYAAGEAVRAQIPGHRTYAETRGMWDGPFAQFKLQLDAVWRPYISGQGRLDEILPNLFREQ